MARMVSTLQGYLERLDGEIGESGLKPADFDDVAPIAIVLFADLKYQSEARAAISRLQEKAHPVLKTLDVGIGDKPSLALKKITRSPDRHAVMLLYKYGLCQKIASLLDSSNVTVERDDCGSLGIAVDGESAFTGDNNDAFAWYMDSASVSKRCHMLPGVSASMLP